MSIEPLGGKHLAAITVAISTRSRPEVLARCLEAILSGSVLPEEIVVVDQSQDDLTQQAVNQRQQDLVFLNYIHHSGSGLGVSQNVAFAHAKCPIVAVTDDDCVPTPEWIARIEDAFASGKVDAVTGRVLPLGPDLPGRYPISSRTSPVRVDFSQDAMPWDIGSGNNFAVKCDWLKRVGGNDERLGPGAPGQGGVDMELFYRLLRAGARIRYEPEALVYHQRTDRAGRISRRSPYGHGIGACCALWIRNGDRNAVRVLARWLILRSSRLLSGLWRRQWMLAYEEVLVLSGTVRGLGYGLRA